MAHIPFGNESADRDQLLEECAIPANPVNASKPILTGRWGTGKTALLLIQHAEFAKLIPTRTNHERPIWYVHEGSLSFEALKRLEAHLADPTRLRRALEALWRGHIIRVYARVLTALGENTHRSDDHWQHVTRLAKVTERPETIWEHSGHLVKLLAEPGGLTRQLSNVRDPIALSIHPEMLVALDRCIRDLPADMPLPTVAIEPIETPTSVLEQRPELATEIIAALINVFMAHFQPTEPAVFQVRLTLPWHRFDPKRFDFPQKLNQYVGVIRWTPERLREFINRRIEWEFRRVGRDQPRGARDAWSVLFEDRIPADCDPPILEPSFDFFLRHTHHRARDLQRLVRRAVENQAEISQCSVDDVLLGRRYRMTPAATVDVLRTEGPKRTEELIVESRRRHPVIEKMVDHLRGYSLPFSTNVLQRHMPSDVEINIALDVLWASGILGVTATPRGEERAQYLATRMGEVGHRRYVNDRGQTRERWTWFEYNWDGYPSDLLNRVGGRGLDGGLVFHPITHEYVGPHHIDTRCPIGA